MKWKPHNYQLDGVKFILANPESGLTWDPGLGKTAAMLKAFTVLQDARVVTNALVIAPLHVVHNVWPQEIARWDKFSHLTVSVVHGPKKEEAWDAEADLYLINPEGLKWLIGEPAHNGKLETKGYSDGVLRDMLIVDESTKFKASQSLRFRSLRRFLSAFNRRHILTGTPIPNGYQDLWAQVYILDQGHALGSYVTHFRNKYCVPDMSGYGWSLLPEAPKKIEQQVAPLLHRLSAKDHLKLPKRTNVNIKVPLPAAAYNQYRQLEREFFVKLDKGELIDAVSAGVLTTKLRQFASGAVYVDDNEWKEVHTAKLDRAADLIAEIGQPTIIVYEYRHEYERICDKMGYDVPTLSGATPSQVKATLREWNRGELPLLAMHPASGGHGLNLQKGGHHMIFFGLTYNLEHYQQVAARIDRQGQEHPTFFYHMITEDTIDLAVRGTQHAKAKTQNAFLNAIQQYRRHIK